MRRAPAPVLALLLIAAPVAAEPISAARIAADVKTLASDGFAGRGPGEVGEAITTAWLAKQFARIGLQPAGDNGGWLQKVPLTRLDRQNGAKVRLQLSDASQSLLVGKDMTLAPRQAGRVKIEGAPLVVAGFGVVDAAGGWEPFAGVDMAGKVAVFLANDPDFEAGADLGFQGRRLVLAGRIGSKFAAAARAGAVGALVIHEDAAASYPFAQVAGTDALPQMLPEGTPATSLKFSGWLSGAMGAQLLAAAGLDLAQAKTLARNPYFRARALPGARLTAEFAARATPVISHNVVGVLPGAAKPAETLLYGAHWDANGRTVPDAKGDPIRNGAIDNATGTAELLEVARAFVAGPRPARSIVFAAWTAEEKGLLGSSFHAAHPARPLAGTVAVINLDPHVLLPATRTLELIGGGRTSLEDDLAGVAKAMGLQLVPEPNPEAGWYFRSDHFPFAQKGVPALAFRAGRDLQVGGEAAGNALIAPYNQRCYHQPCDEFRADMDFTGVAQEAEAAWRTGLLVANRADKPVWKGPPAF
jgi:Zn-dependent M28 family amino/carboxypeptidase